VNRCSSTAVTATWLDCNGTTADGAETPILYNSDHCGACNNPVDVYPQGMGWCDQGQVRLLTCDLGWKANLAGTACDQCNSYLGGLDIPDNGLDENCDGADATHSPDRGLYLDPTGGSDSGDGSPSNPFRTFGGLIDFGWTANPGKREVYAAQGTLTDSLVTQEGLVIVGGYTRDTANVWTRTPAARTDLHAPWKASRF
jgi:hypothetical protein